MSWWEILLLALVAIVVGVVVAMAMVALALRDLNDGFDKLIDDEEEHDDRNGC